MFIDTHSHVYLKEFDEDRKAMILTAENEGIGQILMPAIDNDTHAAMLATETAYPGKCISMMGLHPCSVKEDFQKELAIVADHFEKRSFIAVGETGLDFYWDNTFVKEQYFAFESQIEIALAKDIPIVIHSRNSIGECIEMVKKKQEGKLHGVFHCFSGSIKQANQIIELGFYLGIGGVLTFKNSGLDKVMEVIDLKHIVLETDSPYLAPVPFRGKRNECSYIKFVVEKLAGIKNISKEDIAGITTGNARNLFNI